MRPIWQLIVYLFPRCGFEFQFNDDLINRCLRNLNEFYYMIGNQFFHKLLIVLWSFWFIKILTDWCFTLRLSRLELESSNNSTVLARIRAARFLFQIRTAAALISNKNRASTIRILVKNFDRFQIFQMKNWTFWLKWLETWKITTMTTW
jgi:hypothetical protein